MKYEYREINLRKDTLALIGFMNDLIDSYMRQGFTLSVRQLYYQLVARDKIPNTEQSYKRIASIINDGRLAGLIDWDAIEDRNRDVQMRTRWTSGSQIMDAAARSFHMDMWDNQENRVLVIVEKAALAGVLEGVCNRYDVPLLAARGYPSVSIVREIAIQHIAPAINNGQYVTVLHLGDHDPSGIDMTRDLEERFNMFIEHEVEPGEEDRFTLDRIALTMDQIAERKPPPNPAKTTDARFGSYIKVYGRESWELDALDPNYLNNLVDSHIHRFIDDDMWTLASERVEAIRSKLSETANQWRKAD